MSVTWVKRERGVYMAWQCAGTGLRAGGTCIGAFGEGRGGEGWGEEGRGGVNKGVGRGEEGRGGEGRGGNTQ